jgi:hypothetical protein
MIEESCFAFCSSLQLLHIPEFATLRCGMLRCRAFLVPQVDSFFTRNRKRVQTLVNGRHKTM